MKHKIIDDVNVNVEHVHSHELPVDEIEELIDKVVDGVITVIAAATAAHILRKVFSK